MRPAGSPARNQAALRTVKQRPTNASGAKNGLKPTSKIRTANRLSAHKVSLFKHARVKAVSCSAGARSPLMSSGPLELYQIVTPALNAKQDRQEMNYLSLGRNGNIVHPILPRLQVTRLSTINGAGPRFLITFYNPERYWELEFLPSGNRKDTTLATVAEFESVIASMCKYKGVQPTRQKEDDLDYLLNDDDDAKSAAAAKPTDEAINEAFKRAMLAVRPPVTSTSVQHNATRRFSSYVPDRYGPLPKRASCYDCRRVFSDPPSRE
ncbi:uncharacterized protein ZBIST_5078 [Zygosaccharomyces bailii]|nr:uncharacterized protein ZBIST_5078 [Zygosaccharomyces bailii]